MLRKHLHALFSNGILFAVLFTVINLFSLSWSAHLRDIQAALPLEKSL
jgi:hypothetical protein